MDLTIISVGRLKRGPEQDLAADYDGRIQAMGKSLGIQNLNTITLPESSRGTAPQRMAEEAAAIGEKCTRLARPLIRVALHETGQDLTSAHLADWIDEQRNDGTRSLCFMIGGPDGLDRDFLKTVDKQIAFGRATWPHRLVRILLAEQIYRSLTIIAGHPYHRS